MTKRVTRRLMQNKDFVSRCKKEMLSGVDLEVIAGDLQVCEIKWVPSPVAN
jgi:hypothetical protein